MNTCTIASDQTASVSEVESFAHDLRNPLAAIHVSAEMLVRSSLSRPQVHRLARNMYCASVRIRELLEQCLDHRRHAERSFEIADLRDVVAGAVDRIAVSAEFQSVRIMQDIAAGLLVSMDKPGPGVVHHSDRDAVRQQQLRPAAGRAQNDHQYEPAGAALYW